MLYTEAKLALVEGDVRTARTLFAQCPPTYKRTRQYVDQCRTYETLCHAGLVERGRERARGGMDNEARLLMPALVQVLPDARSESIVRYSDALARHGYARLEDVTVWSMEAAMEHADMATGHRLRFAACVDARTPGWERLLYRLTKTMERCGASVLVPALSLVRRREEGDEEEEETAGDE